MNASELYQAGQLQDAVAAQTQEVKAHPADQARRMFLFELLLFTGDLDRACRQIEAIRHDDPKLDAAVLVYRQLLDAEEARRRVLREGGAPQFFRDPPEHVRRRLQALTLLREGKTGEAHAALAEADAAAPVLRGTLNDKSFEGLRDWDDRFGPVLEVLIRTDYYWVPLEQVAALTLKPPRFPRDLVFAPVQLALRDGPEGAVFMPALYPETHEQGDEAIRLGRTNDWLAVGELSVGLGCRAFRAGEETVPLMDCRQLTLT